MSFAVANSLFENEKKGGEKRREMLKTGKERRERERRGVERDLQSQ